MYAYSLSAFLLLVIPNSRAIECYTGLKLIAGQSIGSDTIRCDNSNAQCYNMTASAAAVLDVVKAGCSLWRCMFARDRCISTVFQNVPISLCCCSADRCNVGQGAIGGFQRQSVGGWNAAPDKLEPQEVRQHFSNEEVARRFNASDLDDDILVANMVRGDRHSAQSQSTSQSTQAHSTILSTEPHSSIHSTGHLSSIQSTESHSSIRSTEPQSNSHSTQSHSTSLSTTTQEEIQIP